MVTPTSPFPDEAIQRTSRWKGGCGEWSSSSGADDCPGRPQANQVLSVTNNIKSKTLTNSIGMLKKFRKPDFGCRNEIQFYIFGKRNLNLFFGYFRQENYIKITKCQVQLIHTFI